MVEKPPEPAIPGKIIDPLENTTQLSIQKYQAGCTSCEKHLLKCKATGYPLPDINWKTEDGNVIASGQGYVEYLVPEVTVSAVFSCTISQNKIIIEEKKIFIRKGENLLFFVK